MKYLKRYENFYNEDFKELKENFAKRESEEDEKEGDQGFDRKDDKSQSSDIPAEVETPSMSGSEGGSGHKTAISHDVPKEVTTSTFESNMEEGCENDDCEDENCEKCNDDTEKVDEGAFRKFFTGHESSEDRDKAMMSFHKALDDAQAAVDKAPEKFVFNRESLEAKAKANNYKGGLRIQKGGRDKSRAYVVYDEGATGFQDLASAASAQRQETLGM